MSSLRFLLRAACVVLVAVAATDARAADVVIHEFLAANSGVHLDGDGDAPDWIELYNTTVSPVQLGGWYLTDRAADLTKWRFPDVTLPAGGYLVIFASGKDRSGPELHTNFKLDMDGEYLALVRPDGATVEHEFAPAFPPQRRDISYGMTTETTVLVGNDVLVDVLVPTGAVPAGTWELPGFIPGPGWLTGVPVPVGYHVEDEGGTGFEAAAYWSLDGTLAEWHGVSDGRFFGGAQPTYTEGFDGKPQGALLLDGTDDYVEIPAGGACPVFNLPAYTVAMWVKGLPQPDYRVYSEGSGSSNSPLFNIGTDNTGATGAVDIYIRTDSGDAVVSHVKSQGMAFDGTWHHIAWVDAGGNAALYIDGVRDPVNFNYSKPRLTLDKVAIGAVLRSAPTHWFQGAIDEVAVWDFALTPDEIAELAAKWGSIPIQHTRTSP